MSEFKVDENNLTKRNIGSYTANHPVFNAGLISGIDVQKPLTGNTGDVLSYNGTQFVLSKTGQFLTNLTFVDELADFPEAEGGVITLQANTTYFLTTGVNLAGNRIVCNNSTIMGGNGHTCYLYSTGLADGVPLLTTNNNLTLRNIGIKNVHTVFNVGNTNTNVYLDNIVAENIANMGSIDGISSFNCVNSTFTSVVGFVFEGTLREVAFDQCKFTGVAGTIMTVSGTVSRQFRLTNSNFQFSALGQSGLTLEISAVIPVEGLVIDKCVFTGTATAYISGVTYKSDSALFTNNVGIINGEPIAMYHIDGTAATNLDPANTPVLLAGTTDLDAQSSKFSQTSDNVCQYDGNISKLFNVSANVSFIGTAGDDISFFIAKNGSVISTTRSKMQISATGAEMNLSVQGVVTLAQGDDVSIFVESNNTNDITAQQMTVVIQ